MKKIKDMSGKKFGKLTVIEFVKRENNRTYWLCKCECGGEKVVRANKLADLKSCGCDIITLRTLKKIELASFKIKQKKPSMTEQEPSEEKSARIERQKDAWEKRRRMAIAYRRKLDIGLIEAVRYQSSYEQSNWSR